MNALSKCHKACIALPLSYTKQAAAHSAVKCRWKYVECDATGRLVQTLNLTNDDFEIMLSGVLPPGSVLQGLTGMRTIDIRYGSVRFNLKFSELPSRKFIVCMVVVFGAAAWLCAARTVRPED
jgi:hypothetical protein